MDCIKALPFEFGCIIKRIREYIPIIVVGRKRVKNGLNVKSQWRTFVHDNAKRIIKIDPIRKNNVRRISQLNCILERVPIKEDREMDVVIIKATTVLLKILTFAKWKRRDM